MLEIGAPDNQQNAEVCRFENLIRYQRLANRGPLGKRSSRSDELGPQSSPPPKC